MEEASCAHHEPGEITRTVCAVSDVADEGEPELLACASKCYHVSSGGLAEGIPDCSGEAAPEPGVIFCSILAPLRVHGGDLFLRKDVGWVETYDG